VLTELRIVPSKTVALKRSSDMNSDSDSDSGSDTIQISSTKAVEFKEEEICAGRGNKASVAAASKASMQPLAAVTESGSPHKRVVVNDQQTVKQPTSAASATATAVASAAETKKIVAASNASVAAVLSSKPNSTNNTNTSTIVSGSVSRGSAISKITARRPWEQSTIASASGGGFQNKVSYTDQSSFTHKVCHLIESIAAMAAPFSLAFISTFSSSHGVFLRLLFFYHFFKSYSQFIPFYHFFIRFFFVVVDNIVPFIILLLIHRSYPINISTSGRLSSVD
jgi:hypothetical protein